MLNIAIRTKSMEENERKLGNLSGRVGDIGDRLIALKGGIDRDIRSRQDIDWQLNELCRALGDIESSLRMAGSTLGEASRTYMEADKALQSYASSIDELQTSKKDQVEIFGVVHPPKQIWVRSYMEEVLKIPGGKITYDDQEKKVYVYGRKLEIEGMKLIGDSTQAPSEESIKEAIKGAFTGVREYIRQKMGVSDEAIGYENGLVTLNGKPLKMESMLMVDEKTYAREEDIDMALRRLLENAPLLGDFSAAIPGNIQLGEVFHFDVCCPNADHAALTLTGPNGIEIKKVYDNTDYVRDFYQPPFPGIYQLTFKARNTSEHEDGNPLSETKEVTYYVTVKGTNNAGDWIPKEMNLDGSSEQEKYLKSRLAGLGIKWNQEKVHVLWEAVAEINKHYGVQMDPRFLLAIIIHEGTGSFNTSSSNLAADGQHGAETNYSVDLMKANSLVFGKILGYIKYGSDFKQAIANNSDKNGINGNGDIFQYCNWATPIIRLNTGVVETGVYAGDGSWHDGVRAIYEKLTYTGAAGDYSDYLSSVDSNVVNNIAQGINIPSYNFAANQNAQDWRGIPNGNWTIIGRWK